MKYRNCTVDTHAKFMESDNLGACRASVLTDDQQLAVVHQLLARLKKRPQGVKVTILNTLKLLGEYNACIYMYMQMVLEFCIASQVFDLVLCVHAGLGGKEVVLAILPLLVDTDVSLILIQPACVFQVHSTPSPAQQPKVRSAAFCALEKITGIVNRFV